MIESHINTDICLTKTLKEELKEKQEELIALLAVRIENYIESKRNDILDSAKRGNVQYVFSADDAVNLPNMPKKERISPSSAVLWKTTCVLSKKLGLPIVVHSDRTIEIRFHPEALK